MLPSEILTVGELREALKDYPDDHLCYFSVAVSNSLHLNYYENNIIHGGVFAHAYDNDRDIVCMYVYGEYTAENVEE